MQTGSFSQDSLKLYQDLLNSLNYEESSDKGGANLYDFTRCLRPDGSAYGTRGECQQPNKPAPVNKSITSDQESTANAGVSDAIGVKDKAVQDILSQNKPVLGKSVPTLRSEKEANQAGKPLSAKELGAYKAGGGDAAAKTNIGGMDQVIDQGNKNLTRMDQSSGRKAITSPVSSQKPIVNRASSPDTSGLTAAQRSAYAAGGGNAAAMKGKSIEDVIAQGNKNLERMDQGKGRQSAGSASTSQRQGAGSANQGQGQRAAASSPPNVSGLTAAQRSAYAAGGGNAAAMKGKSIEDVIAQGNKNLERMDQGRGRQGTRSTSTPNVSGLTAARRSAYAAGGGNAAAMKGKSIDEVIAQGKKNLDRMDQGRGRQGGGSASRPQRQGTGSTRPTSGQRSGTGSNSSAGRRLSTADRSAYAAGGGNAAGMKGKSIEEIIAQGKRNLRRMDQGRGRK